MAICHCILPWVLIIIPYLLFKSNTLNIIHTGDNIARGLGVRLSRERLILFFIAVMLSSAAVAVAGSISFIGLMGPHIAKRIVDHVTSCFTNCHFSRGMFTCYS